MMPRWALETAAAVLCAWWLVDTGSLWQGLALLVVFWAAGRDA